MTLKIHVTPREQGTDAARLRAEGKLPAVVYGPKQEPIALALDARAFAKLFAEAGESTIIELEGLKEPVEVLIHEVNFAPTKGGVEHVDFYAIERGKEMETTVPIEFIGESPVEKTGGVITKALYEIDIKCRPSNLPRHIEVDLSILANIDDRITVADLKAPEGVKFDTDPEAVVAIASEVEEEEESAPADMDAIEVEKKGKGEETED